MTTTTKKPVRRRRKASPKAKTSTKAVTTPTRQKKVKPPKGTKAAYELDEAELYKYEALDTRNRNIAQGMLLLQLQIDKIQLQFQETARTHNEHIQKLKNEYKKLTEQGSKHDKEFKQFCEYLCTKYDIKGGVSKMSVDVETGAIREEIKDPDSGKTIVV